MPVSRALRRLLRIRELEEEQSRLALESAMGALSGLEKAVTAAAGRDRQGRRLVSSSAQSGELPDRLAGVEESRLAVQLGKSLEERKDAVELHVEMLREDFLVRRVERRQAEVLIERAEALDAIDAERRGQQALDDWHRSRSLGVDSRTKSIADTQHASGTGLGAGRGNETHPTED